MLQTTLYKPFVTCLYTAWKGYVGGVKVKCDLLFESANTLLLDAVMTINKTKKPKKQNKLHLTTHDPVMTGRGNICYC